MLPVAELWSRVAAAAEVRRATVHVPAAGMSAARARPYCSCGHPRPHPPSTHPPSLPAQVLPESPSAEEVSGPACSALVGDMCSLFDQLKGLSHLDDAGEQQARAGAEPAVEAGSCQARCCCRCCCCRRFCRRCRCRRCCTTHPTLPPLPPAPAAAGRPPGLAGRQLHGPAAPVGGRHARAGGWNGRRAGSRGTCSKQGLDGSVHSCAVLRAPLTRAPLLPCQGAKSVGTPENLDPRGAFDRLGWLDASQVCSGGPSTSPCTRIWRAAAGAHTRLCWSSPPTTSGLAPAPTQPAQRAAAQVEQLGGVPPPAAPAAPPPPSGRCSAAQVGGGFTALAVTAWRPAMQRLRAQGFCVCHTCMRPTRLCPARREPVRRLRRRTPRTWRAPRPPLRPRRQRRQRSQLLWPPRRCQPHQLTLPLRLSRCLPQLAIAPQRRQQAAPAPCKGCARSRVHALGLIRQAVLASARAIPCRPLSRRAAHHCRRRRWRAAPPELASMRLQRRLRCRLQGQRHPRLRGHGPVMAAHPSGGGRPPPRAHRLLPPPPLPRPSASRA